MYKNMGKVKRTLEEYAILTVATLILVVEMCIRDRIIPGYKKILDRLPLFTVLQHGYDTSFP